MDMQSTSLKTAQPPFYAGMVRAFITIVSAFALVAGLALAISLVRGQPSTASVSKATVDQALIDFRQGERALLTPQELVVAQEQAFLDVIAAERSVLTPQELLDQVSRADAARWAGAYVPGATVSDDTDANSWAEGYVLDAIEGSLAGTDDVSRGGYTVR